MAQEGTETAAGPIGTLIGSLKNMLSTFIALLQTRLEIVSTELQEEIGRAASLLLWTFIALFAAGIGLFVGALVLIFAFWETHRVLVSMLVMGFFFLLAIVAVLVLRAKLKGRPRLFAATIEEFSRDRAHLDGRHAERE
ncbi:MAG TPA: phage holin family protein [Steroidobacteraceae bacterium]|nr:phage holin family protein [Steroidobacteraceae bacterium]